MYFKCFNFFLRLVSAVWNLTMSAMLLLWSSHWTGRLGCCKIIKINIHLEEYTLQWLHMFIDLFLHNVDISSAGVPWAAGSWSQHPALGGRPPDTTTSQRGGAHSHGGPGGHHTRGLLTVSGRQSSSQPAVLSALIFTKANYHKFCMSSMRSHTLWSLGFSLYFSGTKDLW